MTVRATLYTLGPSHFSERARWGLDHVRFAYDEHRIALGPHAPFLRAKGLPDTTLPVLAVGGVLIQGSGSILDHVGMFCVDAVLEERFVREIGPLVRRFIYAAALSIPDSGILEVLLEGVSATEAIAGRNAWPQIEQMFRRGMTAPDHFANVIRALDHELTWFDRHVQDQEVNRRYRSIAQTLPLPVYSTLWLHLNRRPHDVGLSSSPSTPYVRAMTMPEPIFDQSLARAA